MKCVGLAAIALLCAVGCNDLPAVTAGTCGNGVLEPGEDCDGFAGFDGGVCGAASEAHACFLTCGEGGGVCPVGWGCGLDGQCRQPSGQFALSNLPGSFAVDNFAIGDVDGDGRADLIGNDASQITVRYGDEAATFSTSIDTAIRLPRGEVAYGQFDADGLLDAVVPIENGVFALLGDASRTLQPVAYSSFSLGSIGFDMAGFEAFPNGITEMLSIEHLNDTIGVVGVPDQLRVALPAKADDLIGPIAVGEIGNEALLPRDEVALAFRGADRLYIYRATGNLDPQLGTVDIRMELIAQVLTPAPVSGGAVFADVDGDGRQDLVTQVDGVNGKHRIVVAYNQGGTLANAVLEPGLNRRDEAGQPLDSPLPLAAADVNGDGRSDYVFSDAIMLSVGLAGAPTGLAPVAVPVLSAWQDATAADFNGDGRVDVAVATSELTGVDVYLSTGSGLPNRFHIDADRPPRTSPRSLAAGDFDGDLVTDLAFVESGGEVVPDELLVSFSGQAGGFSLPVTMGRFESLEQLVPADAIDSLSSLDSITDIIAVSSSHLASGDVERDVAILFGDSSRRMIAPFQLVSDPEVDVPEHVMIGDFNLDGTNDLLVVARPNQGFGDTGDPDSAVWLLVGEGSHGGLDAAHSQHVRVSSYDEFDALCSAWAVGDIDVPTTGQGFSELVGFDNTALCNFLRGTPDRASHLMMVHVATEQGIDITSEAVALSDLPLSSPEDVQLADLDDDGDLDLVALFRGDWWLASSTGTGDAPVAGAGLAIFWNNGGAFDYANPQILAMDDGYVEYRKATQVFINDDEFPDLVVMTDAGMYQSLWDTDAGGFAPFTEIAPLTDGRVLRAGDLDGDGLTDFAVLVDGGVQIGMAVAAPTQGEQRATASAATEEAR